MHRAFPKVGHLGIPLPLSECKTSSKNAGHNYGTAFWKQKKWLKQKGGDWDWDWVGEGSCCSALCFKGKKNRIGASSLVKWTERESQ